MAAAFQVATATTAHTAGASRPSIGSPPSSTGTMTWSVALPITTAEATMAPAKKAAPVAARANDHGCCLTK